MEKSEKVFSFLFNNWENKGNKWVKDIEKGRNKRGFSDKNESNCSEFPIWSLESKLPTER